MSLSGTTNGVNNPNIACDKIIYLPNNVSTIINITGTVTSWSVPPGIINPGTSNILTLDNTNIDFWQGCYSIVTNTSTCNFTIIPFNPLSLSLSGFVDGILDPEIYCGTEYTLNTADELLLIAEATGGDCSSYNYSWYVNNNLISTTNFINTDIPGTYEVTVYNTDYPDDIVSCTFTLNVVIRMTARIEYLPETGNKQSFDCTCNFLSISNPGINKLIAEVSGGIPPYTYVWFLNNIVISNNLIAVITNSGTYTVTITDSEGNILTCSLNVFVEFPNNSFLDVSLQITNNKCSQSPPCGSVFSIPQIQNTFLIGIVHGGITPYIYDWTTPASNFSGTNQISVNSKGMYSLTVTDSSIPPLSNTCMLRLVSQAMLNNNCCRNKNYNN